MTRLILAAALASAACSPAAAPPVPATTTTTTVPTTTTTTAAPTTTTHTHRVRASRSRVRSEGMPGQDLTLEQIARCESGGNPRAVSRSGRYTGKHQFDDSTWRSVGGSGRAMDAPEAEQDARAAELFRRRGAQPWPTCGRRG